jgi:IS4 transposase
VDRSTGLICDQTIRLTGRTSSHDYPDHLRRVAYRDPETGKKLDFLSNDFTLLPLSIAELYRLRWQVELFFKWIKQHLRIKTFYGTSPNAVKTQIWIAISVYLLVAIARKRLGINRDL